MLTVLMGTFGVDYIAVMDFPAIRLLRNLTQNGGFLSRMDVLMTGIWLFSLFFFASGGIQYSRLLLKSVMEESVSESLNIILIVVIFVVTIIFGNMQNSYYIYRSYMYYIGTPAIVLTLIILLIKKNRGQKIEKNNCYLLIGILFVVGVFFFSNSTGETLEEKDYIMALEFDCTESENTVIFEYPVLEKDEAQSVLDNPQQKNEVNVEHFKDFVENYDSQNAKIPDLQHFKVLLSARDC